MADNPNMNAGNGSPQRVAFELFDRVLNAERKTGAVKEPNREYMLDLYAECLEATAGKRDLPEKQAGLRRGG